MAKDEPIEAKRILLLRKEMPYLHSVNKTRSDLFTDFWVFFMKNFFFPKFELLNSGCSLSASAAYLRVFTVFVLQVDVE